MHRTFALLICLLSLAAAPASQPAKYIPATPAEHAKAIAEARAFSQTVSQQTGVTFTELETDHFLIYTDWDPQEFNFLKTNLEGAYSLVSRQFVMSPKDNIFVGKLPVYMFAQQESFAKYAKRLDHMPEVKGVLGYYYNTGDGSGRGRLAMWKPVASEKVSLDQAEFNWAHTLTHEFTHSFIARYHTNGPIPIWLNEGTAEYIAQGAFPYPQSNQTARIHAFNKDNVGIVFTNESPKPGTMYPVMMTMVAYLVQTDPDAYIRMFNLIKDGAKGEAALKQCYGFDYPGLTRNWRQYAQHNN